MIVFGAIIGFFIWMAIVLISVLIVKIFEKEPSPNKKHHELLEAVKVRKKKD